jgi:hypothetical protein
MIPPLSRTMVAAGMQVGVFNLSSTTTGIPSGTWCGVTWDDDGIPWVTPVDCGN